jgi:hypothetical protein
VKANFPPAQPGDWMIYAKGKKNVRIDGRIVLPMPKLLASPYRLRLSDLPPTLNKKAWIDAIKFDALHTNTDKMGLNDFFDLMFLFVDIGAFLYCNTLLHSL